MFKKLFKNAFLIILAIILSNVPFYIFWFILAMILEATHLKQKGQLLDQVVPGGLLTRDISFWTFVFLTYLLLRNPFKPKPIYPKKVY